MILGLVFAILVAIFWSIGEVTYTKLSNKVERENVYFYQYLFRSIIYLAVVIIFDIGLFKTFDFSHLLVFLPIILCDLVASYVVNIAVRNGKLSVVSPIMAAYPIIDILLGIVLLKEKISFLEIGLATIITLAIVVLARSEKKTKRAPHPLRGIFFSLVYMFLIAFSTYFEKNAYIGDFSVFELYYYKGLVYLLTSGMFMLIIGITPVRLKKVNWDIVKGSAITPIGNILYSFALNFGNMIVVTPVSSMYTVLTNFLSRKVLKEKISFKESICITLILLCTLLLIICGIIL